MMRRFAVALVGLLVILSVSVEVGCAGCRAFIYKTPIERALHEDSLTGNEPTDEHAAAMRKVNLSGCPDDFQTAYLKYVDAWDQAAKVQKAKVELDSEQNSAVAAAVLSTILGSGVTPWSDHVRAETEIDRMNLAATTQIHSTWENLIQVAGVYGAQPPQ